MTDGNDSVVLKELVLEHLVEKRRTRRWGIFFKILIAVYFLAFLGLIYKDAGLESVTEDHTAMVRINGVIGLGEDVNADTIARGLRNAFEAEHAKAVVIRINSPGGSPVQSAQINNEIHRLRALYPDKPVYAVIDDICASGGYYIAVAAQQIYADPSSIVGSIGVRGGSFGFVEAMKKLGVERRVMTAGKNKALLDPFLPENPADKQHFEGLLSEVHQHFIAAVKRGRGERINDDEILFSGLFWSGDQAKELGLIDDFASTGKLAREIIGAEEVVDYTPAEDWLQRFSKQLGASIVGLIPKMISATEYRLD